MGAAAARGGRVGQRRARAPGPLLPRTGAALQTRALLTSLEKQCAQLTELALESWSAEATDVGLPERLESLAIGSIGLGETEVFLGMLARSEHPLSRLELRGLHDSLPDGAEIARPARNRLEQLHVRAWSRSPSPDFGERIAALALASPVLRER